MAGVLEFLIQQATEALKPESVVEALNATAEEAAKNGTETRPKSTPEGMMTAYISIVIMALLPIIIGSIKSVKAHENSKKNSQVGTLLGVMHR